MKIWNLGYPSLPGHGELLMALERWEKGDNWAEVAEAARRRCAARWARQHDIGVESTPLGEFSLVAPVLDTAFLFGIKGPSNNESWWRDYLSLRGADPGHIEIGEKTELSLQWHKLLFELEHSRSYPYKFHAAMMGPASFAAACRWKGCTPAEGLTRLVPLYASVLKELKHRNIEWVQLDEPIFSTLAPGALSAFESAYATLAAVGPSICLLPGALCASPPAPELLALPVAGLHLDLVAAPGFFDWIASEKFPKHLTLSLGLVGEEKGKPVFAPGWKRILPGLARLFERNRLWIAPTRGWQDSQGADEIVETALGELVSFKAELPPGGG